MALTVGELVAYVRADSTGFDSTIDRSESKFKALGATVSSGIKTISTSFVAITTAAVGIGAAVVKVGYDYNRLQQSSRAALTTLLGSAEAANAQMDKLDAFAKNSPFAKQVFITAQQQLLGFGVTAEKVLPTLDAIQNAVAAVGGSNEQVSQVTYALAQMQGQGKLTGETLNQLGQYGIDAATVLGAQLGKTGAEIRELASKPGGIPVDQVWDPLVTGLMERFGGATANIKLQMDGAVDRIKGAWRDIGSALAAPFVDPKGGGRAVEWANKTADALRALETKVKPLVTLLVDRFAPGLGSVSTGLDKVRGAINSWDISKVNGQLDKLSKYTPLIAAGSAALYAYGTTNIPILSTLGLTINPVVAGIAALIATSPQLRAVGTEFLYALQPLLPVLAQLGVLVADTATEVGETLAPAIGELLTSLAPVIVSLGQQLAPVLSEVVSAAVPVAEVLADVLGWLAQLPGPVTAGALAFGAVVVVLPSLISGLQGLAATAAAAGGALKAAFIGNPITLAITLAAAAVGVFVARNTEAKARVDTLAATLDQATASVTENTRATVYNNLVQDGTIDKAKALGLNLRSLVDAAIDPSSQAMQNLADKTENARQASVKMAEGKSFSGIFDDDVQAAAGHYSELSDVLFAVSGQSDDVAASQAEVRDQIAAGATATEGATNAFKDHAEAVGAANAALQENIQKQRDAAGVAMSAREAQIAQTESQKAVTAAIEAGTAVVRDQNGELDLNADGTIAADKALLDLVSRNVQYTEALEKNNASSQDLYQSTQQQRDAFIANAQALGYTTQEAKALADQYGLIPRTVETKVVSETTDALNNTTRVLENLNLITGRTWRTTVQVDSTGAATYWNGPGTMRFEADGGFYPRAGSVKAYADGHMSSQPAQYRPGGSYVVWAEDETEGETFIPHAMSKRVQAMQYLDATARKFGQQLVPAGYTARADGAMTSQTTAPASALAGGTVVLRVGEREFTAYVEDVSGPVALRAVRGYARGIGGSL